MLRVRLKSEPDIPFVRIDDRDYDATKHERLDPEPIPPPPQHESATPDLIAVILKHDPGAPQPVIIEKDTFDPNWHELFGDGSIPKPPEPEPEPDPLVLLNERVAALEARVSALELPALRKKHA